MFDESILAWGQVAKKSGDDYICVVGPVAIYIQAWGAPAWRFEVRIDDNAVLHGGGETAEDAFEKALKSLVPHCDALNLLCMDARF